MLNQPNHYIYVSRFEFSIPGRTRLAHIAKNDSRISQRIKDTILKKKEEKKCTDRVP